MTILDLYAIAILIMVGLPAGSSRGSRDSLLLRSPRRGVGDTLRVPLVPLQTHCPIPAAARPVPVYTAALPPPLRAAAFDGTALSTKIVETWGRVVRGVET